jgi:hypothetical protein
MTTAATTSLLDRSIDPPPGVHHAGGPKVYCKRKRDKIGVDVPAEYTKEQEAQPMTIDRISCGRRTTAGGKHQRSVEGGSDAQAGVNCTNCLATDISMGGLRC